MANVTINSLPTANTIDGVNDRIPIYTSSLVATQGISRNTYLGLTSGPAGLTDTQALTNKTLGNTNTVTLKDTLFTLQDDGDVTKQLRFQLSGLTTATTRTLTVPDVSDTLVTLTATQTLTNKTITSPTISSPTITNATITADALAGFTNANNGTLYGISITASQFSAAALTNGTVTPEKLVTGTGSSWGYTSITPTLTNITIGNGTITGYYKQTGKTVHYYGVLTFGTTTVVTGQADVSLPVNASSNVGDFAPIGTINARDTSANTYYMGWAWKADGAQRLRFIFGLASGTYVTATGTTSTVPFTWATTDLIFWSVVYEAA